MTTTYPLLRGDKIKFNGDVFDILGPGKAHCDGVTLSIQAKHRRGTESSIIPDNRPPRPLFGLFGLFGFV